MKYKAFFLILIFSIFSLSIYSQDKGAVVEEKIDVVIGLDKITKFDFVPSAKVQVGNQSILAYEIFPRKKEITFKGLKPGRTSVTIRNPVGDIKARYLVNITSNDQSQLIQKLKEFVGHVEGIKIEVKADTVIVGGKIVVPSDMGLINIAIKRFCPNSECLEMVELASMSQVLVGKTMQEEIQKAGMKNVTVRIVNKSYWLEGFVTSKGELSRTLAIAKAYLPDNLASLAEREQAVQKAGQKPIIQNFIQINEAKKKIPIPKLIKITAQFVELSKDYNKIFGFTWRPLLSTSGASINFGKSASEGITTQSQGTIGGTISNLFPKLSSAKSAGHARIIQSGVVIVTNGVQAKINKKSSKPFAIGSGEFTKAEKAESGFDLSCTPNILEQEKVKLTMGMSVSSSIGDPPETLSNNISTIMVVKSKESAVVGGVVINKDTTDYDRNPPFANQQPQGVPLFNFLKSKSMLKSKSQFVVFVTPEIIDSASQGTKEIYRKFRGRGR